MRYLDETLGNEDTFGIASNKQGPYTKDVQQDRDFDFQ